MIAVNVNKVLPFVINEDEHTNQDEGDTDTGSHSCCYHQDIIIVVVISRWLCSGCDVTDRSVENAGHIDHGEVEVRTVGECVDDQAVDVSDGEVRRWQWDGRTDIHQQCVTPAQLQMSHWGVSQPGPLKYHSQRSRAQLETLLITLNLN